MTAVFETLRVRGGAMPFLERHAVRMARSVAALGIPDPGPLGRAIPPLSSIGGSGERVIRIEAGMHGVTVTTRDVGPAIPFDVVTCSAPYQPYPHKTTERAQFIAAQGAARAAGAADALLVTRDGFVAEGTAWSLFWWEGDGLATPALDLGILPGVARERIAGLVPLRERRVRRAGLAGASLFAANAVRGVLPIARLDGAAIPADPRTAGLARAFWPG